MDKRLRIRVGFPCEGVRFILTRWRTLQCR